MNPSSNLDTQQHCDDIGLARRIASGDQGPLKMPMRRHRAFSAMILKPRLSTSPSDMPSRSTAIVAGVLDRLQRPSLVDKYGEKIK